MAQVDRGFLTCHRLSRGPHRNPKSHCSRCSPTDIAFICRRLIDPESRSTRPSDLHQCCPAGLSFRFLTWIAKMVDAALVFAIMTIIGAMAYAIVWGE